MGIGLEEKINKYLFQISEIDIFYALNFISKYDLEKTFQEDLMILISTFFSTKGITYLSDDFNENKTISFELFQLSLKILDNLFAQNSELKDHQQILEIIKDNEQNLKYIKINDISLKIKEIYDKNNNDEKYLNQIIELYQTLVNLIKDKNEIAYINNFDILYKLGDNNNYLLNIIEIMKSFNAFIQYIDDGNDNTIKKREFTRKLNELNKYCEESKNVNQEYFKNDFNDQTCNKIIDEVTQKYNEDKEKYKLTNFVHFIIENYPPITMPKSINEFKKKPSIKILAASYSKRLTTKFKALKNKEKLREKINVFVSEMFSNNVELIPVSENENDNGEDTDNEDDVNAVTSGRTNYTNQK